VYKRGIGRRLLVAALALVAVSAAATSAAEARRTSTNLSLVAYSTPAGAFSKIIPAFQATPAGKDVSFKQSYGASGTQAAAVHNGLSADVVNLSLAPDVSVLSQAGLIGTNWNKDKFGGMVTDSIVVFVVRKGNPKNIKTWDDLLKPGVEVLTPNPFTSGAAKWNLLAAYGAKGDGGKDPEAGLAYLRELITKHVKVQDKSGREALQNFIAGTGDVLLSYEYEVTTANKKGEDLDYVVPDDTIQIENPIALLTKSKYPEQARAFLDYVLSEPAQQRFADWGYRPVNEAVLAKNADKFPTPSGLFTVRDLGDWKTVNDELFDPEKGSVAKIEEDAGVSTAK
jgi:sulfate transport system substrate-binding protein